MSIILRMYLFCYIEMILSPGNVSGCILYYVITRKRPDLRTFVSPEVLKPISPNHIHDLSPAEHDFNPSTREAETVRPL